jgi:hypothetical protein
MNIRIGKSFGLALFLVLGILAMLLVMGTFTSGKVGAAATGTPTIDPAKPSPGANVQVEVTFTNDATDPIGDFGTFSIELVGWGIPEPIDPRDISIRTGADATTSRDSGNPEAVSVSGSTITIELNETTAGDGVEILVNEVAKVVIRQRAGLTAPATAGTYDVTVDSVTTPDAVTVSAELSASPEDGGSDTIITVSGKAFADGTASLYSRGVVVNAAGEVTSGEDQTKIKDVTVSSGAFSTQVEASDLETEVGGYSRLEVVDAEGHDAGAQADGSAVIGEAPRATAMFKLTGTTTISPTSLDKGKLIKISLSDWIQALPDAVMIGGVAVAITDEDGVAASVPVLDNDLESTFYVKVGAGVDLGTKTLVLSAGSARLDSTTSVEITSMALSVDPSSAVAGQEITVEGSGFSGGALLATLTVGGTAQPDLSDGNTVAATRVTSGGRVVLTFVVPDEVTDGSNTVAVTDEDGRIGEVSLTVPEPTIALDPPSSRRGSAVVVNGSGFPAYEFIRVTRAGSEVDIVRSNNMGNWATTIRIPSTATIGGAPADVVASVTVGTTPYEAEAEHSVPGADITLSTDTARGGDTITITGEAFPAFQRVVVQVGGLSDIITGANTDGNGNFSASVLLPALEVGTHLVEVRVGSGTNLTTATKVLTVPAAAVEEPIAATNDTADVFADDIASDNLVRVWMFSNTTKEWTFFDPRPAFAAANTLTDSSSGDIVWVNFTADTTFQGTAYTAGWSVISLD